MSQGKTLAYLSCVAALLLTGCAAPPMKAPAERATDTQSAASKSVSLTRLSQYKDQWLTTPPASLSFADTYTRLVIHSELSEDRGNEAENQYQGRKWYSRAIIGTDSSINLTANISVGGFEASVPLATIGHQSDSDGEQWSRVLHHSRLNFPLFLVRGDGGASVPSVKVTAKGTRSYSSRGAAAAVQIALGVLQATSQAPSVVTRLSEQSTKDRARAVDDAISKLFASGITEEHWTDRDLRNWSAAEGKPTGVRVQFTIPSNDNDWVTDRPVGTWTITFDYPRPSIFADWRICAGESLPRCAKNRGEAEKNVKSELNSGQVLNYPLVYGAQGIGTIRAFLTQQEWYATTQAELAKPETFKASAPTFCRRVVNDITGLGLNGFDAGIVLWAVVNGMPLPSGIDFKKVDDCAKVLNAIDKDRS